MPPAKQPGRLRGAHRMRENGMRPITIWLDAAEHPAVVKAAQKAGLKVATYVRRIVYAAAVGMPPRLTNDRS